MTIEKFEGKVVHFKTLVGARVLPLTFITRVLEMKIRSLLFKIFIRSCCFFPPDVLIVCWPSHNRLWGKLTTLSKYLIVASGWWMTSRCVFNRQTTIIPISLGLHKRRRGKGNRFRREEPIAYTWFSPGQSVLPTCIPEDYRVTRMERRFAHTSSSSKDKNEEPRRDQSVLEGQQGFDGWAKSRVQRC